MEQFLIAKHRYSDIMDFQLQWMRSCETVGKGICITRMGTGRNWSPTL